MGERKGAGWEDLPSEVLAAYDRWQRATGYDTKLIQWLAGGRSGARVGLVLEFEASVTDRLVVLKFDEEGPEKVLAMNRAFTRSPEGFAEAHLVKLLGDPIPLGDWWMTRMEIAGGDRASVVPLEALRHHADLPKLCKTVIDGVLGKWNPDAPAEPLEMTPREFLRLLLSEDRRDRLFRWAGDKGIDPAAEWLFDNRRTPVRNPLALLRAEGGERLLIRHGRAHGDLNVRNVLVRANRPRWFTLIDYGDFADDAPLARDPAHLLLSLAREVVEDYVQGSAALDHLKVAIVSPDRSTENSMVGIKRVSESFRDTAKAWADQRGFGEYWAKQAMLALIGNSLIFVTRSSVPEHVRRWFFELAAYATRAYVEDLEGDIGTIPPRPDARRQPRAEVDAMLTSGMPWIQRTMGNKDRLVNVALELLPEDERFVCLAPCRMHGRTPGSAVIVVSDKYVRTAELDLSYRISGVLRIAHDDVTDLQLYPDRRLGLVDTADVRVSTHAVEMLARGLLRDQADQVVASLEELTGRRLRPGPSGPWEDLANLLRATDLTATTSREFAARTEGLRTVLRQERPPFPREPQKVADLVRRLGDALARGARGGSPHQVRAAGDQADMIRTWLLELLAPSRP